MSGCKKEAHEKTIYLPCLAGTNSSLIQLLVKLTSNQSKVSFSCRMSDDSAVDVLSPPTCWFEYHVWTFSEPRSGAANEIYRLARKKENKSERGLYLVCCRLINTGRYKKQELCRVLTLLPGRRFYFSFVDINLDKTKHDWLVGQLTRGGWEKQCD